MAGNLVVTLADGNYFDQARQLLSSVYHNSGWRGDYMVLAKHMEIEQIKWFNEKGIIVKEIEDIGKWELPNHPRTVLAKFHLFNDDMDSWKRIIYLDADITVTASLDHLLDLRGFWAAVDFHEMKLKGQFKISGEDDFGDKEKRTHDLLSSQYDLDRVSFNSGVMAFDGSMTGQEQYDRLIELYHEYESITLHDQSILNLLFYERWNRLPLAFNNYFLYGRKSGSIRFVKCDGIVNHYILDRVWKTESRDHFPVWKRNLDMSEGINLERRPPPADVWDELRIKDVSDKLESSTIRNETITGKLLMAGTALDRVIGRMGLMIKKRNPKLYRMIHGEETGDQ